MSSLARVFVILNLVLAVGFLFAAATFLAATDNYKLQLAELEKTTSGKITSLQGEVATFQSAAEKSRKEAEDAESARAKADSAMKEQAARTQEESDRVTTLQETVEKLTNRAQSDADLIRGAGAKEESAVAARDQALEEKNTAASEKQAAEERLEGVRQELASARNTISDNEIAIAAMREEIDALAAFKAKAEADGVSYLETEIVKPFSATVVRYDPALNLVMINVGEKDGLKRKSMVSIIRGGTYVGEVRIDTLTDNSAGGSLTIPNGNLRPRVGDIATNTLN